MASALRLFSLAAPNWGDGVPHAYGEPRLRVSAVGRAATGRLKINPLNPSRRASLNRLKTGLQTNEETLAAVSESPSTLQPRNGS